MESADQLIFQLRGEERVLESDIPCAQQIFWGIAQILKQKILNFFIGNFSQEYQVYLDDTRQFTLQQ